MSSAMNYAMAGMVQGVGNAMSQSLSMMEKQMLQEASMRAQKELQIEMMQKQQDMADARREKYLADPNSPESLELSAKKESLAAAKDKRAQGLINMGRDAQFGDGGYGVVGDDGKVRLLNADGTPKNSATDKSGQLVGQDAGMFGMDAKDKIDLKTANVRLAAAQSALSEANSQAGSRKELRSANDELSLLIDQAAASDDPSKFTKQIKQAMTKVTLKGGDVSKLNSILFGEVMDVGTESVKTLDGDGEKTITSPKKARSDGLLTPKPGTGGKPLNIPPAAIDLLKKNPNLAAQFDEKYGQGASRNYIK